MTAPSQEISRNGDTIMLCVEKPIPLTQKTVGMITSILWSPSDSTVAFAVLDTEDHSKLPVTFSSELQEGGRRKISHKVSSEEDALIIALLLLAAVEGKVVTHETREKAVLSAKAIATERRLFEKKCPSFVSCPTPWYVSIIINIVEQCTGFVFNFCELVSSHNGPDNLLLSANIDGHPH